MGRPTKIYFLVDLVNNDWEEITTTEFRIKYHTPRSLSQLCTGKILFRYRYRVVDNWYDLMELIEGN